MVGGSGIGLSSRLGARFRRRPVHLQLGHTVSNANHLTTEIQPTIWKARTAESRARAGPICTDGPAVTLRMWRQASLPDGEGGFVPNGYRTALASFARGLSHHSCVPPGAWPNRRGRATDGCGAGDNHHQRTGLETGGLGRPRENLALETDLSRRGNVRGFNRGPAPAANPRGPG